MNEFVYIVESPSARDLADGRTEGRALCETMTLSGTKFTYTLAVNLEEFLRAFALAENSRLSQEIVKHNLPPIVHLSMHGNDDGIGLTDGTSISWDYLRSILSPLNEALEHGLLVTFSTCGGAASIRMSMLVDDEAKPFLATVGSMSGIPWHDALVAYTVFYHNWFKGVPALECVERMKLASGHAGFAVYSGAAQKQSYSQYFKTQKLVEALSKFGNTS